VEKMVPVNGGGDTLIKFQFESIQSEWLPKGHLSRQSAMARYLTGYP